MGRKEGQGAFYNHLLSWCQLSHSPENWVHSPRNSLKVPTLNTITLADKFQHGFWQENHIQNHSSHKRNSRIVLCNLHMYFRWCSKGQLSSCWFCFLWALILTPARLSHPQPICLCIPSLCLLRTWFLSPPASYQGCEQMLCLALLQTFTSPDPHLNIPPSPPQISGESLASCLAWATETVPSSSHHPHLHPKTPINLQASATWLWWPSSSAFT